MPTGPITEMRELEARVVASRHFNRSERLSGLLEYLCRSERNDPGHELHEQDIGVAVFGRRPGYDTNQDNIVRVNVSELRKRLARYFAEEGAAEPVVIEIPKGAYAPRFVSRALPETLPEAPAVAESRHRSWMLMAVSVVALGLAAVVIWLAADNHALRHPSPFQTPALRLLWSKLSPPGQTTDLVVADSCLSLLQDLTGSNVSLQDYLHDYATTLKEAGRPHGREHEIDWLTSRRYTSLADVHLLTRILSSGAGVDFSVHFARDYPAERIRTANAVLMGSRRSNPWVEVFEERMNFRIEYDPVTHDPVIRNRQPRAGEPSEYKLVDAGAHTAEAYAVVAFTANPSRTGHVLIVEGTGMQGTDAAGELVTKEAEFAAFLDRMGRPWPADLPHFEALLRARIMGGAVRGFDVVAFRK